MQEQDVPKKSSRAVLLVALMFIMALIGAHHTDRDSRHEAAMTLHQLVDYLDPYRLSSANGNSADGTENDAASRVIRVRAVDRRGIRTPFRG